MEEKSKGGQNMVDHREVCWQAACCVGQIGLVISSGIENRMVCPIFMHLSMYQSMHGSIHLSIDLSIIYLPLSLNIYVCVYMYMYVYMSKCPSI